MEQWEYATEIVWADTRDDEASQFLQQNYPDWDNPPIYVPQAMIPYLNSRGKEGWEMVHMQPVYVGNNYDVLMHSEARLWSNAYFCAFKRRLPG